MYVGIFISYWFIFRASSYKALCSKSGNIGDNTSSEVISKAAEATITNLEQQTEYNCWVVPISNGKYGNDSTKQKILTKPLTSPQVNVVSVISTKITLSWSPIIGLVLEVRYFHVTCLVYNISFRLLCNKSPSLN